jgi:hypothetical protein
VLIEIQDRQRLLIHHDVTESVDALLRGRPLQAELRYRDEHGEIHTGQATPNGLAEREGPGPQAAPASASVVFDGREPVRVLPYGIARNRLERATRRLHVPVHLVKNLGEAEVLITTKGFYRKRPRVIVDAERRGLPIYVLRANTVAQMEACLGDIFELESRSPDPLNQALREAEEAVRQVQAGVPEVELAPQNAYVRRRQHELAQAASLSSYSAGEGTERRVRVCRRE